MEKQLEVKTVVVEEVDLLTQMADAYVPEVVRRQQAYQPKIVSTRAVAEAVVEEYNIKSMADVLNVLNSIEDTDVDPNPGRDICGICWEKWCSCPDRRVPID